MATSVVRVNFQEGANAMVRVAELRKPTDSRVDLKMLSAICFLADD
ncbi:MAG TPA: hypothetical protein VJZ71_03640 [Phycisphaerae bacterium]|nr:hypothetical protein [Phycisphaerae bacterium]